MRVAVAGNPNSGKTTLFNALTGSRARVGNYPGVTVERKEAPVVLPRGDTARVIDLPGCYSLTARSPEEEVAHSVLVGKLDAQPDVVVCVVDATQLGRGLYLVLQLLELGLPVVVALNMMDVAQAQGFELGVSLLARRLGVPVMPMSARYGQGVDALMEVVQAAKRPASPTLLAQLTPADHKAIAAVRALMPPEETSVGACLWWLSSNLDELTVAFPSALRAGVRTVRAALPHDFSRRLIAARYAAVDAVLEGALHHPTPGVADRRTAAIDSVLLHPVWGMVVFVGTMFVLFQAVFFWAEPLMQGVERGVGALADLTVGVVPQGHTQSLLIHGVLAGVGNVFAFVPQIAFLFFGLACLEESGYMARAAFLLDRLMRRVGLHGKAFVPLMSSFACAVPGIMAARTVESHRDRLATIFVAPFMSCSARLPVYTLVIAAVFAATPPLFGVLSVGGLVVFAMYLLGFFAAIGTAFLLKRTVLRAPLPPLLLELPMYRAPDMKVVLRGVFMRCKIFVRETGSIIMALSVLLWALLTFPQQGLPDLPARQAAIAALPAAQQGPSSNQLQLDDQAARLEHSIGGRLGHLIEPAIAPLGFDWRIGIGLVASFAAREVLVSTLGQVYALDADGDDSPSLRQALRADVDPSTHKPRFTALTGVSLMVFFVLAMQCLSTVATVKRETNSWRWPLLQLAYMNGLAYSVSFLVYQGGRFMGWG